MTLEAIRDDIGMGQFWRAVGARPLGAVLVTATGSEGPEGFLALSFAHVSAKPPLVLVSVGKTTSALGALRESKAFAANVLPAGTEDLVAAFSDKDARDRRFVEGAWEGFVTGAPVLKSAAAVFDCEIVQEVETEGALTFIAQVVGLRVDGEAAALTAYRGGYQAIG